jgi:tellurite resistance protein TerC
VATFVELSVPGWAWVALIGSIAGLVVVDLIVVHRTVESDDGFGTRRAVIESVVWISIGLTFAAVVASAFGARATGEYLSGYVIEMSLSVDNIFVWALILTHFKISKRQQHRVLFAGIACALALRAAFIFAGVALLERFSWVLYVFGAFLVSAAVRLIVKKDGDFDPDSSRFMRLIVRVIPSTSDDDGQRFFTRNQGRILATPLLSVLLLVEFTDIFFAVDSVPAVLAVSREPFIVFASNAFAILGLRSLYFLLADLHSRFSHLKGGLAVILAFIGVKMLIQEWYQMSTWASLLVICCVLAVAIGWSVMIDRRTMDADPPLTER